MLLPDTSDERLLNAATARLRDKLEAGLPAFVVCPHDYSVWRIGWLYSYGGPSAFFAEGARRQVAAWHLDELVTALLSRDRRPLTTTASWSVVPSAD